MNNAKCRIFTARGVLASTSRVEKFERVLVAILAKINHIYRKTRLIRYNYLTSGKIKNKTIGVQLYISIYGGGFGYKNKTILQNEKNHLVKDGFFQICLIIGVQFVGEFAYNIMKKILWSKYSMRQIFLHNK